MRREAGPRLIPRDVLEHDHEAARPSQVLGRRLADEEASLDGRAEGGVELRLRDRLERRRLETGGGAVDDDVQPAELRRRTRHERPRRLCLGEVAVAASGREHRPAFGLEPAGDGGAELARAAREQRARQLACSNRFATSSQLTTSHHAAR